MHLETKMTFWDQLMIRMPNGLVTLRSVAVVPQAHLGKLGRCVVELEELKQTEAGTLYARVRQLEDEKKRLTAALEDALGTVEILSAGLKSCEGEFQQIAKESRESTVRSHLKALADIADALDLADEALQQPGYTDDSRAKLHAVANERAELQESIWEEFPALKAYPRGARHPTQTVVDGLVAEIWAADVAHDEPGA